ncbi:MAG: ankyrin repeat domain-containing protein [Bacteroidales bacterium]|nr:ankyrin repeat domain-containing protein [Bacteroidales bacterium]
MPDKTLNNVLLHGLGIMFFLIFTGASSSGQQYPVIIDTSDYLPYPDGLNINLMIASAEGYTSEVHRLVKLGADVDATDPENISPLIYAVANNNLNTVKALLEYNPNTGIMTNSGESALHIAAKDNMLEIAEALIRTDADLNLKDRHGATPLHYASAYGYFYMCDLLIYYNAAIEARSEDGSTPLMAAVYSGQADISDLLLQSGASVNMTDNEGYTPLMIAAQNNDTLVMNLLLGAGSDMEAVNAYKYDALGIAIRNNNYEAYRFLVERTEPGSYKNNKDILSPALIARKYGRSKILAELNEAGLSEASKLSFDHVKIQAGIKASMHDYYTGFGLSFKDPLLRIMLNAGFEIKPSFSRVLVESSPDTYYQYYDKRYIIYAGAGKEFKLHEDYSRGSFSIDLNLNIGYMIVHQYRGTNIKPPDRIRLMPQALLRWNKGNINVHAGYEYMKTDLYKIGPSWFILGLSYDVHFDKMRGPLKKIRWY